MGAVVIVVLGLVLLVAAVIVGLAGVLGNAGGGHLLTDGFAVFGYHVTGSTGSLFLYGMVLGAVAVFGLGLLLTGARHTSLRGQQSRRELARSRRETAVISQDRDDLIEQRDTARTDTNTHTVTGPRRDSAHDEPTNEPARATHGPLRGRVFGHRGPPRGASHSTEPG